MVKGRSGSSPVPRAMLVLGVCLYLLLPGPITCSSRRYRFPRNGLLGSSPSNGGGDTSLSSVVLPMPNPGKEGLKVGIFQNSLQFVCSNELGHDNK